METKAPSNGSGVRVIDTAADLAALIAAEPQLVVLDVRLNDDYAGGHIPGAVNQCVYEMVFLSGLAEKGIGPGKAIVVYGADAESHEARVAAEKLTRAGYVGVVEFRGGFDAWVRDDRENEGGGAIPADAIVKDGRHDLDLDESRVGWTGRSLLKKHTGSLGIQSGWIETQGGLLTAGEIVLDMKHITCDDLAGTDWHDVLIRHLQSDDFFDVERFPTATFRLRDCEGVKPPPGGQNLRICGELTLRGVSRPVEFTAAAGATPDGRAAAQGTLTIDRTQWGSVYGSGRFFRRLGMHLVNDLVEIEVRMVAKE